MSGIGPITPVLSMLLSQISSYIHPYEVLNVLLNRRPSQACKRVMQTLRDTYFSLAAACSIQPRTPARWP